MNLVSIMPKLTIYQVSSLNGEGKHIVGTLSYKLDESFADARLNLSRLGYFDFPYDFVDDTTNMRMQSAWEKGNLLEDANKSVTIISKTGSAEKSIQGRALLESPKHAPLTSMANCNSPSGVGKSTQQEVTSPTRRQDSVQAGPISVTPEIEADVHVSLLSDLMSPKLIAYLEEQIRKFKEHLALCKLDDMDWCVKSYDKKGIACVGLWCGECQKTSFASKKGAPVDNASIKTCFANFRNGHMPTSKHINAMAKNRGEILDSSELNRRVKATSETAKQILGEHVAIVEDMNSSQSSQSTQSTGGSALFEILG